MNLPFTRRNFTRGFASLLSALRVGRVWHGRPTRRGSGRIGDHVRESRDRRAAWFAC